MNDFSSEIKNVCIYGVGGVGGYFGGKITDVDRTRNEKHAVYFIARGAHLDAINSNGLRVLTAEKTIVGVPAMATSKIDEIPSPDLLLLCVKSYDLDKTVKAIRSKTTEKTIVLPLLNGADIYDRIRAHLDMGVIFPACVYVGTHIVKPGVIAQKGGEGAILFGKDPRCPEVGPEKVMDFFESTGIAFKWNDDPFPAIWSKYIFIAAFGLVTVFTGKTLGEIRKDGGMTELVRKVMKEIKSIAERKGISLPADIVMQAIKKADDFPFETKTSYQRDVENKGRLNEGDLYGGTIIRFGRELAVPTPVTTAIYSEIQQRVGMA